MHPTITYKSTLLTLTNSESSIFKAVAILSKVSIDGELVPRSIAPRAVLLKSDNSASFSWDNLRFALSRTILRPILGLILSFLLVIITTILVYWQKLINRLNLIMRQVNLTKGVKMLIEKLKAEI